MPFTHPLVRLYVATAAGLDALVRRATPPDRPRESGQGTVEYVALILLVAVVLAGVVAATRKSSIGSGEIGATIVKKIKGALESVK